MVVLLFMVSVCANEKFYSGEGYEWAPLAGLRLGGLAFLNPGVRFREGFSGFQLSSSLYEGERALPFVLFMRILILCLIRVVGVSSLESGPLIKRL
jgi:hypothetical protein